MTSLLTRTIAAELIKLRGLPAILATAIGTVAAGAALAAALAASAPSNVGAAQVTAQVVPFVQVGLILLGVLTVASEYAGRQIATTLIATPDRPVLLAAKTIAYLVVSVVTSSATVGAGLAAGSITLTARGIHPPQDLDGWRVLGAVTYLVLLGVLTLALATLLRSLVPPLVTMLALVLIISPLLSGHTEHARWLPDHAGSLLYLPRADTVFTPATGALVLLAWIIAAALGATLAFDRRDA